MISTLYAFICISLCLGDENKINEDVASAAIDSHGNTLGIISGEVNTLLENIRVQAAKDLKNIQAATECAQSITPRVQCPICDSETCEQECSYSLTLGERVALIENGKYGVIFHNYKQAIFTLVFALTGQGKPLGAAGTDILIQKDINFNVFTKWSDIIDKVHDDEARELTGFTGVINKDLDELISEINTNNKKKLIVLGTPSNPCSECVDIIELCRKIKESPNKDNILIVFDNTQGTAVIHRPSEHCADFVINSGEILFGLGSELDGNKNPPLASIVLDNEEYYTLINEHINRYGLNVTDSLRLSTASTRLSTLNIRIKQQCSNAVVIATLLESSEIIKQVNYPGLASHSHHEICAKTMKCGGPTITFKIKGDPDGTKTDKFIECVDNVKPKVFNIEKNCIKDFNEFSGGITTYITKVESECGSNNDDTTPWIRFYTGIENISDLSTALQKCLRKIDGSYIRKLNQPGSKTA